MRSVSKVKNLSVIDYLAIIKELESELDNKISEIRKKQIEINTYCDNCVIDLELKFQRKKAELLKMEGEDVN